VLRTYGKNNKNGIWRSKWNNELYKLLLARDRESDKSRAVEMAGSPF
jgi:hypothetical protein